MKIKAIRFHKENLKLVRPYTIAYKTVDKVENCIIEIEAENGLTGIGASNPSKMVVGVSVEDTMEALKAADWDYWIGQDIRSLQKLLRQLPIIFLGQIGVQVAMDIALHDLFTKYLDIPLCQYLGQEHHEMPTSITIGIKSVEDTLEEAEEYIGREFRYIKVKTGESLEKDLERLYKLREKFGNNIDIRVDANQGYDKNTLEEFWTHCEKLNIEFIEQPLPQLEVETMRSLETGLKTLLAADESLVSPDDAWNLASGISVCGIFNIKLMKCGGVYQALRIASVAELSNIQLMWGCNDESIISITAALHAAFSCKQSKYLDLDGSLDLAKDIVEGGFEINKGIMRLAGGSGLGVRKV